MPSKNQAGPKSKAPRKPRGRAQAQSKPEIQAAEVPRNRAILERGDLFFFYRPDVDETSPGGLVDVRRFHIVLRPEGGETLRLITVGRKSLPEARADGRSYWAFVDRVFRAPDDLRDALAEATYETETQGERLLPAARPAGEGVYAIVRHGRGTILGYALELPEQPGEVQHAFHIEHEGRFAVSIKNPEVESPAGLGLGEGRRVEFPDELMARFGDRRWVAADPPAFLDHEGAELVLIGGREANDEIEFGLEPQAETEDDAEVFKDLHVKRSETTIRPLFEGTWE